MPSKIKSKLLTITVLCATLSILSVIAPLTAALYSIIFMGVSLFLSIRAWNNARGQVELQYKVSSFITLTVLMIVGIFIVLANIAMGDINTHLTYIQAGISGIIAIYAIKLLFGEYK